MPLVIAHAKKAWQSADQADGEQPVQEDRGAIVDLGPSVDLEGTAPAGAGVPKRAPIAMGIVINVVRAERGIARMERAVEGGTASLHLALGIEGQVRDARSAMRTAKLTRADYADGALEMQFIVIEIDTAPGKLA